MLTIILLAFSMIGLIGLVIGNRFILIIFSASMTLILIASITIYAIGKTENDPLKPKVPYYLSLPYESTSSGDTKKLSDPATRSGTSSTSRWPSVPSESKPRRTKMNRTRFGMESRPAGSRTLVKKSPANKLVEPLEDYVDESQELMKNFNLLSARLLVNARSLGPAKDRNNKQNLTTADIIGDESDKDLSRILKKPVIQRDKDTEPDSDDSSKVENEQWVNYERYLYEKYLNIISLSIDLIMHTILSGWMALLLDEDSDQCFGSKTSGKSRKKDPRDKEAPVYNYKGVRYSIRPEPQESATRIVVG